MCYKSTNRGILRDRAPAAGGSGAGGAAWWSIVGQWPPLIRLIYNWSNSHSGAICGHPPWDTGNLPSSVGASSPPGQALAKGIHARARPVSHTHTLVWSLCVLVGGWGGACSQTLAVAARSEGYCGRKAAMSCLFCSGGFASFVTPCRQKRSSPPSHTWHLLTAAIVLRGDGQFHWRTARGSHSNRPAIATPARPAPRHVLSQLRAPRQTTVLPMSVDRWFMIDGGVRMLVFLIF